MVANMPPQRCQVVPDMTCYLRAVMPTKVGNQGLDPCKNTLDSRLRGKDDSHVIWVASRVN